MNLDSHRGHQVARHPTAAPAEAWTLVEVLGVLAVLAIMSALFVPWMLRDLDTAARTAESRSMTEIANAVGQTIRRERRVPDADGWAGMAALALGRHEDRVRTNARGGRRVWVVDPRLRLGPSPGTTLPFAQSTAGSHEPAYARVVLLSSLGEPLPATVRDGVATSNARFDAIWSATPGTVPGGWSWNGRPEDLTLERLDFTEHWVPVLLHQPASGLQGRFGTDAAGTNAAPPGSTTSWYVRGTLLRLHDADGRLQWATVVQSPLTLTFERGAWRGRASLWDPAGHWSGPAVDDAMGRFLGAAENPEAAHTVPPATRDSVWRSMSNYLNAYLEWSATGFSASASAAVTMDAATTELEAHSGSLLFHP